MPCPAWLFGRRKWMTAGPLDAGERRELPQPERGAVDTAGAMADAGPSSSEPGAPAGGGSALSPALVPAAEGRETP